MILYATVLASVGAVVLWHLLRLLLRFIRWAAGNRFGGLPVLGFGKELAGASGRLLPGSSRRSFVRRLLLPLWFTSILVVLELELVAF